MAQAWRVGNGVLRRWSEANAIQVVLKLFPVVKLWHLLGHAPRLGEVDRHLVPGTVNALGREDAVSCLAIKLHICQQSAFYCMGAAPSNRRVRPLVTCVALLDPTAEHAVGFTGTGEVA